MDDDTKAVEKRLPTENLIRYWADKITFDQHLMNPSTAVLIKHTVKDLEDLQVLKKRHAARIICLVGSARFWPSFIMEYNRLSQEGYIVLTVSSLTPEPEGVHFSPNGMQKILHLAKIDLCDELFVINVKGYIGETTAEEIDYAEKKHKAIKFLEPNK